MADLMAGIIVGIVALPLAIAFGIASGVSPEKGIITAIIAGFIISLMGGSKVQIGGPTGAFIVIIYGIIQQYGEAGLIVATLMAGVLLVLLGVFKLGAVIKFIPYPIIVGFTSGIAVTIFTIGNEGLETLSTFIYADARKGGLTPELRPLSTIIFVTVLVLLIVINKRAEKSKS